MNISPARPSINEAGRLESPPELRFPYPTQRPDSIVLIFDGKCKFCISQVRMLQRLDFRKQLSFISLHDPQVTQWWPDLSYDQLMQQIFVVPAVEPVIAASPAAESQDVVAKKLAGRKQRIGGAEGFRFIAWRFPLLWPVALVLSIPFSLPLWKSIYDFIARQRYRFGRLADQDCGPDGTCELHFGNNKQEKP